VLGSMLLNIAAKQHFSRIRPQLWLSVAPETSFSFPSGHAMGSATLGVALCFLFWPTRWRWPVIVASAMFVVLVGFSRIYLGVHYPSDVLGGWAAGTAWAVAVHQLVVKRAPPP
jgi:membrane-associated phospholipid phosphatase